MTIKLSLVGTSFLNTKDQINKCIDSVLNQSYKGFEFIIILEPKEKNLQIFKKFQKKDPRIHIIINKKKLGLVQSLNRAIKKSKGKYISRVDFDDIYLKNKFLMQINFLDKKKNIGVCGTNAIFFEKKKFKKSLPINHQNIVNNFYFFNSIIHPSVMIRKEVLDKHGFYNEHFKFAEDLELWLRLIKKKVIFYNLPQRLLEYRIDNIALAREKKNYYFNFLARKKHAIQIYGTFLGYLNIIIFFFLSILPQNFINIIISLFSLRYKKIK